MSAVILIPAYQPSHHLVELIEGFTQSDVNRIIVVNDGSDEFYDSIFESISRYPIVDLLKHSINLGKGAALKTGLNHFLENYPTHSGVVTVDADGQHSVADALALAQTLEQHSDEVILGVRNFNKEVPFKSYVGNQLTIMVTRMLYGLNLRDTQTGLRAIPKKYIPLFLRIPFNHYEFEMEMLVQISKNKLPYREHPIETIYMDDNSASHFNPLADSMRIYFVLLRYIFGSLSTALIDYLVFFLLFTFVTKNILVSVYSARLIALIYNYSVVNWLVFHSSKPIRKTVVPYLLLVIVSGFISASITSQLANTIIQNVLVAKIIAELILYLSNFFIQSQLIFQRDVD